MDFTINTYNILLDSLKVDNQFFLLQDVVKAQYKNSVFLRHDVDLLPENSLIFAKIEQSKNIFGTYYFRAIPKIYNEKIIAEIAELGHEIGYQYEDLSLSNGNIDQAYDSFCRNLEKIRNLYPVKTICMHGSPRTPWDNRKLWEKYNYKKLGIIAEPYFDINFNKFFYLTDTGRRWDGWKFNLRDKVPQHKDWIKKGLVFHSTNDIIKAVNEGHFPNKVMMTFHPQRWTNRILPWLKEWSMQSAKNIIKRAKVKKIEQSLK